KPLAGARLTATHRSIGFVNAQSDAEGRYRLDQIPAGTIRVEADHEGRRTWTFVTVKDAEVAKRDIALFDKGKGELRGRVTAGGKPLQGAQIMVASNHGLEQGVDAFYVNTGEDGSYLLSEIPEGMYLVQVVSTMLASGAHVKANDVATVD